MLDLAGNLRAGEPAGTVTGIEQALDSPQTFKLVMTSLGVKLVQNMTRQGIGQSYPNRLDQAGCVQMRQVAAGVPASGRFRWCVHDLGVWFRFTALASLKHVMMVDRLARLWRVSSRLAAAVPGAPTSGRLGRVSALEDVRGPAEPRQTQAAWRRRADWKSAVPWSTDLRSARAR